MYKISGIKFSVKKTYNKTPKNETQHIHLGFIIVQISFNILWLLLHLTLDSAIVIFAYPEEKSQTSRVM